MNEWWDSQTAGLVGGIGGAVAGTLAGMLGAAAGVLAPRGKAKGLVVGMFTALTITGVAALGMGMGAVLFGQPRHVWFPLLLLGGVLAFVCGPLTPVIRRRYQEAEQRRLQAAEFRRS